MSPLFEDSPLALSHPHAQPEYTQQERAWLLNVAHEAVLSVLEAREVFAFAASEHLAELRGVFTTLYLDKKLRGCVGYPAAIAPLYRAVMETAQAAAFDDPRFPPLEINEASGIKISISVLSPLAPISPAEIEVGQHGLVISA